MWTLFPPRASTHVVCNLKVGCPLRRADVDIERCVTCDWLKDFRDVRGHMTVRCAVPRPADDRALYLF